MKKAFTVYIDDDDNVKGLGIALCMCTDKNHNSTTMVTRECVEWNALYVPHIGDVKFWEERDD